MNRTEVGSHFLCTANCLHFDITPELDVSQDSKRPRVQSGGNESELSVDEAIVNEEISQIKDYSVYLFPIPTEVPEAFDHVRILNEAKLMRQSLFVCLSSSSVVEGLVENELSATAYKRDITEKYGPVPWHDDRVPSLVVNLAEVTGTQLATELSTKLSLPECTFPHALAQSVFIVDSSSNSVDSGGLFAFAANNLTNHVFKQTFGKRDIPIFFGSVKVRIPYVIHMIDV